MKRDAWVSISLFLWLANASASAAAPGFQNVTADAGLNFVCEYGSTISGLNALQETMRRNMGNGAAAGDYDNDNDLDLYVLGQLEKGNRLFRNNLDLGLKTFTDVTPPEMVDGGMSRIAHFVDLDNDGFRDLIVANDRYYAPDPVSFCRVYRNNEDGTFADVTATSGFDPSGYLKCGMAIADYDRDGLLDVYISNWSMHLFTGPAQFPGENHLYRNLGGFVFEDVSANVGLAGYNKDSFTPIFTDFDGDLYPDLFVAVDHFFDVFYWNQGGASFFDTSQGTWPQNAVNADHQGNDMGVGVADIDDDGDLDMFSSNIFDPSHTFGDYPPGHVLYMNQLDALGTTYFTDQALARGVFNAYWGWGADWVDVENDSDLDLIVVTGFDEFVLARAGENSPIYNTPTCLFTNDGTAHFARCYGTDLDQPADSRALIVFDYDRDGDEDAFITNTNQPLMLMENTSTDQGNWLHLVLSPDNVAVNATVTARIGDRTLRRDVVCGDSYLAGTPTEVHLGLGSAPSVDLLTIRWADGVVQEYQWVGVNQILWLNRGLTSVELLPADRTGAVAFPNPSDGRVRIAYRVPSATKLSLTVLDLEGRTVHTEERPDCAGAGEFLWDGRTDRGKPARMGVYFYRIEGTAGVLATGRVALVR